MSEKFKFIEYDTHYEIIPQKCLISIDWLQVNVRFDYDKSPFADLSKDVVKTIRECNGVSTELDWHFTGKKSKHFNKIFEVTYQNLKIADLEVCHNGGVTFHKDICRFKINNMILYMSGLRYYIYLLMSHLECISYSISRLDIAADSFNEVHSLLSQYQGRLGYLHNYKKANGRKFNGLNYDFEKQCFEGFNIGSRVTGLFFTCYNKGNELKVSNKLYLQEFLQNNGCDLSNSYRFELRLSKDRVKEYFKDDSVFNNIPYERSFNELLDVETGELRQIDNCILSDTFLLYCRLLYIHVLNNVLQLSINGKPIQFKYPIQGYIERIQWDGTPNYRLEKQIFTYYLHQYFEHDNDNIWNWHYFANLLLSYSTFTMHYIMRKFHLIRRRFPHKKDKIAKVYEKLHYLSGSYNVVLDDFEPKKPTSR